MVRLTRIYTRGGDSGETSLGDGARVSKHALRVAAYGTVDEANAAIGIARLHVDTAADAMLGRIQNDLFDLGADLCTPAHGRRAGGALRIVAAQTERLESEIDAMNATLAPLELVHPARRAPRRSSSAPRANGGAASRAPGQRTGRRRRGQPRGVEVPEPAVGPPFRSGSARQRSRHSRRALETRCQPLIDGGGWQTDGRGSTLSRTEHDRGER